MLSISEFEKTEVLNDTTIYVVVEKMPMFCDNVSEADCEKFHLLSYIFKKIEYKTFKEGDEIKSYVVVSFIIEKDGSVSNIKVMKGAGISNIKEVLQAMPKWIPGEIKGEKKRVKMQIPIRVCFR